MSEQQRDRATGHRGRTREGFPPHRTSFQGKRASCLVLLFAMMFVVSCKGGGDAGPAPAASAGKKAKFTIGMSQCNLGEPWRVQMNADIAAAAKEHPDYEIVWRDAQNDTRKQRAHVEELAQAKEGAGDQSQGASDETASSGKKVIEENQRLADRNK